VLHALEHSPQRERLLEIVASRTEDHTVLAEAVDIMTEAGSIEFARGYGCGLVTEAKAALEKALAPSDARKLLLSMADFFVKRVS